MTITFNPSAHPRERSGRFTQIPASQPDVGLPDNYSPGSGVAPDGFVFEALRDEAAPSEVMMHVEVRQFEPSYLNPSGQTWHLSAYPAVAGEEGEVTVDVEEEARYFRIALARPPRDLGRYTHLSHDEVFSGDSWLTLEEAPRWIRDAALPQMRQRNEADVRFWREFAESEQASKESPTVAPRAFSD